MIAQQRRTLLLTSRADTLTPFEIVQLATPLSKLSTVRAMSVLNARDAWVSAGLAPDKALTQALGYADRLLRQHKRVQSDARLKKYPWRELHAAADGHRAKLTRVLAESFATARTLLAPREQLVLMLERRDVAGIEAMLEGAPDVIAQTLRPALTEVILDIMEAGATVAAERL